MAGEIGTDTVPDQVFALKDEANRHVWFCIVRGRVFGEWPDKGSALAGLVTEQRRAERRAASSKPGA